MGLYASHIVAALGAAATPARGRVIIRISVVRSPRLRAFRETLVQRRVRGRNNSTGFRNRHVVT